MLVSQFTLPVNGILLVESQESTEHRANSVSVILFIRDLNSEQMVGPIISDYGTFMLGPDPLLLQIQAFY